MGFGYSKLSLEARTLQRVSPQYVSLQITFLNPQLVEAETSWSLQAR